MRKIQLFILILFCVQIASAQLSMKKEEGGILITENGKNVLFYQTENKSLDGAYERCNYIHPLWASDGTVLTEDFPEDHYHHRGIFWAWHQVVIGDKRIGDPWEIKDFEQEVTELEFVVNKGVATINSEVLWKSILWTKNNQKVPYLKENTKIIIHPQTPNYRRIDFEIRLLALEEDLKIGGSEDDKGYSGFSVRMKLPEDILFEGPNGKVLAQRNAVESEGFINMSGSVLNNKKKGGIVMVDHPENPMYPQKWILRDKNSMQNPQFPGSELFPVSTSEPLILNYSLLVYDGKLSAKKIKRITPKIFSDQ